MSSSCSAKKDLNDTLLKLISTSFKFESKYGISTDEDSIRKTELCLHVFNAGTGTVKCRFGEFQKDQCLYAHDLSELCPRVHPKDFKIPKCWGFQTECKYGPRCRYKHDEERWTLDENTFLLVSEHENVFRICRYQEDKKVCVFTIRSNFTSCNKEIVKLISAIQNYIQDNPCDEPEPEKKNISSKRKYNSKPRKLRNYTQQSQLVTANAQQMKLPTRSHSAHADNYHQPMKPSSRPLSAHTGHSQPMEHSQRPLSARVPHTGYYHQPMKPSSRPLSAHTGHSQPMEHSQRPFSARVGHSQPMEHSQRPFSARVHSQPMEYSQRPLSARVGLNVYASEFRPQSATDARHSKMVSLFHHEKRDLAPEEYAGEQRPLYRCAENRGEYYHHHRGAYRGHNSFPHEGKIEFSHFPYEPEPNAAPKAIMNKTQTVVGGHHSLPHSHDQGPEFDSYASYKRECYDLKFEEYPDDMCYPYDQVEHHIAFNEEKARRENLPQPKNMLRTPIPPPKIQLEAPRPLPRINLGRVTITPSPRKMMPTPSPTRKDREIFVSTPPANHKNTPEWAKAQQFEGNENSTIQS